tara:strand:- start:1817 stop:2992 length:1176 start_codon:yes stop_codon:yes gene_type:complete
MATTFKQFLNNDVTATRTLLHESIPLTGSIVSGTYNEGGIFTETNVKNYSHGLFQSVYDYPYLSSSANHIFDITVGYSNNSPMSSSNNTQNLDKINIYNQMAQVLVGHDINGNIRDFDLDGNLTGGKKIQQAFFFNFARLLQKDEIKKGSFVMEFGAQSDATGSMDGSVFEKRFRIGDFSGSSQYLTNSPAGEYGILYATASDGGAAGNTLVHENVPVGLLYYQAGIAVVSGSIFNVSASADSAEAIPGNGILKGNLPITMQRTLPDNEKDIAQFSADGSNRFVTGSSISGSADMVRNRLYNVSFNNTTELNSTIYFCRAGHNEFNYSSNPTYLQQSQIRVKETTLDQPVSYITTIGLYSATNELLAVAKLSEPLKKTPETELTLRVRLDY